MKIPNKIFDYNLSPSEFKVYCALKFIIGKKEKVQLKHSFVAQIANVSQRTVERSIPILCHKGLVAKFARYNKSGDVLHRSSNAYSLPSISGKYFNLDYNNISKAGASASAFYCYALLCRCGNHVGRSFPSLKRISKFTGLCRATVVKSIKELQEIKAVMKEYYIKFCGAFGCNNYFVDKKIHATATTATCKAMSSEGSSQSKTNIFAYIINLTASFCQEAMSKVHHFFRNIGSLNLAEQNLTHLRDVKLRRKKY